ncbi:MAG: Crp/Fnr family transcriptional regulator [Gammaproteobacteria bacterium]|nr:Crp/Fnr family transcriptional regulator [Gammaproteobacteria bacterium]
MNINAESKAPIHPKGWETAFPTLNSITDPAWLDALQSAKEQTMPAKVVVIHKNDPCRSFLLVTQGIIRVYQSTEGGREHTLYRTQAGEICILTLQNLLAGTDYSAEAVTEEEVKVVSIPAEYFYRALSRSENFRNLILSTLAHRLNSMMQLIEQVTFQGLDLRLACMLGQLFGQRNAASISVTHQDLAAALGTTREVISRLLKGFERMGCIKLRRGEIELLSPEALTRLTHNHA